jgi:hypothetical protein
VNKYAVSIAIVVGLVSIASVASAAPIVGPAGSGGADTLESWDYLRPERRPTALLARFVCAGQACEFDEGVLAPELFTVVVDAPAFNSGTWSFSGFSERIGGSNTTRVWLLNRVIISEIRNSLGGVRRDRYSVSSGPGEFFDGAPVLDDIAWDTICENCTPGVFDLPIGAISFYGKTTRIPEPSLVALFMGGSISTLVVAARKAARRQ